jgi:SNF2 family DNA or RNA helicase
MSKLNYTTNNIIRAVSSTYYARGKAYHRQGRVSKVSCNDNQITGTVRGSRAYTQHISLHGSDIDGTCSCPVGYNCKHVAAVLLAAMEIVFVDYASETISTQVVKTSSANDTTDNAIYLGKGEEPNTTSEVISDYHTNSWLAQMKTAINVTSSAVQKSPSQNKQLVYVLKIDKGVTKITPYTVAFKKDGSYRKTTKAYNVENITSRREVPQYISFNDQFILYCIEKETYGYTHPESGYEIVSQGLLDKILKTGKCHWKQLGDIVLSEGDSKQARFAWEMFADGRQKIICTTDNKNDHILKLTPPWYVNGAEGVCGKLNTDIPDTIARAILSAPALSPMEVEAVRKKLKQYSKNIEIPIPSGFEKTKIIQGKPIPHLYLYGHRITEKRGWYKDPAVEIALARISFDYDGNMATMSDRNTIFTSARENTLIKYKRDLKKEHELKDRLHNTYNLRSIKKYQRLYNITRDIASDLTATGFDENLNDPDLANSWIEFVAQSVPELRQDGWQIEIDESFPYNITHPDDDWYAEIDESSGIDWFGLELGVSINGKQTNLLPILLAALKDEYHAVNMDISEPDEGQLWYFPFPDGSRLALPARRIWMLMSFLKDLYNFESLGDNGSLRLSRLEAADLAELEAAMKALDLRWFGGEKIRKLGQKLKDFTCIKRVEVPKNFKADLRDYQKDGLNWMQFLREYGLGGILADDMGLGKTIQALAYILREKEDKRLTKPVLVVAPTSVLVNWHMEVDRFAPKLKTLALHGSERKQHFDTIGKYDLVLTTYPLLTRDKKALLEQEFHTIILDEAQYIKNSKAKNTQVACQLKADHRICMTGTPVENHLGELWSQFNFLLPGFLGDEKKFRQFFRNPIERNGNMDRNAALVRRIKPFILRRTKDEIATELPPKTLILRTASLEKSQRDLYETIRVSMQKKVRDEIAKKGFARSHIVVLEALLRLRQTCCDPRLLKMKVAEKVEESAKLDMLMEMIPKMVEEGRRILLFSQFVSMLELIENELDTKGLKYVKLTGQTKDRKTPIETFQNGDVSIFLISLKAGGTGLNLTAADTVFHYDPWWNPAAENQATDRAHRIGQDKPVFVYKLLTEGTVEEKILQMQEKKKALAEGIFNPNSKSANKLTADDINALFEPLR